MGAEYCYKDIVMEVDDLNDDVMDVDLADHMDVDSGDIEEYMSLQMSDTTSSCKFDRALSKTDIISKRNHLGDVERSDFNNQRKVFEKKATDENSADVSVSEKIRNVPPNSVLLEDVANEKHFIASINNSPAVNEETEKIKENNCSGSTITEINNLNINNDFMVKENKMLENTVVSNKANSETKYSEPKITGHTNSQNKVYDSQENSNKNVTLDSQNISINCNKQNTSNNLISSHGVSENREKVNMVTDNLTYNNKVEKCAMNPAQCNNQTNILNNSNDSQNQSKEGHVSENKAATELNVKENSGLEEPLSNLNTSGESEVDGIRAEYDGMEETQSESLQMVWYIINSLLKNTFEKIEFINNTSGVGNIIATALDRSQNSKVETESQFLSSVPALSYLAKKILRENNVKNEKTQPLKLEKFSNYESENVDSNSCEKLQNSVGDNSSRKEQSLKNSVQQKEISLSKKGDEKLGRRLRASLKRKEIREMKRESLKKARTTRHSLKESRKKIEELERSEKPVRMSNRNKQGKIAISKQIRELTIKKEICTGRGQRSRPQKKPLTSSGALKRSRRVDDDINKRSSRLRNKSVTGNSVKREPRTKSVRKYSPSPEHPPICEIFLETNFLEQNSSMFFNEDVDDGTSKKNIRRTSSRMIKREGRFNPSVKHGLFSSGGSKFKRKLEKCVVKMERMPVIERLLPEKKSALDWDPSICELCEPKRLFLSKTALANHVNEEHINNSSTMVVAASPPRANTTSTVMKSRKPKLSSQGSVPVSEKPPVNIPTLSTNTVVYKTRSKGAVEKPKEEAWFNLSKRLKYVCDKCGRKFLSGAGLTSHKNRVKCDLVNSVPVQETDPLRNESFHKMTQGETAKAEFSVETKSNHKNGKIVLQFRRRQCDNRQSPPSKNLNNNNDDFADKMKPAYNNNEKNLHSQIKYVLRKKGPKKR